MRRLTKLFAVAALALAAVQAQASPPLWGPHGPCACSDFHLWVTIGPSADDELARFIDDTKKEPGARVEPLPEVKPYQAFTYTARDLRSPFAPGNLDSGTLSAPERAREFLEQFPLDTLKMVGTLKVNGRVYGLVQAKDGLVHRVSIGDHMGQADGKIVEITPAKISLIELVPDGAGPRPAALALN
jgi:type IV pilus assembly protein PilP